MLRPLFKGPFAAGGGFTKESGDAMLAVSGGADFIVYGKLFTSNPDLPARFEKSAAAGRSGSEHVLRRRGPGLHYLPVAVTET